MVRRVVARIKQALVDGRFVFSIHATAQFDKRYFQQGDLRNVGRTLISAINQGDDSYKVTGLDLDDMEVKVVCRFIEEKKLLIITVIDEF